MAEGILRQSYDSTGRKIYPLTVIDGILRSVDVNVMDGHSRGAYAIIDSMKNYDVDFAEADLTTLDVMTRTWDESTRSYSNIFPILSVNDSGFKVDSQRTSTFTGVIKALASVHNGGDVEFGAYDINAVQFTKTGRLSTKNESNVLSGKIELFNSNSDTPFFVAENGQLSWKSQAGNGLTIKGTQLTYNGSSVVIGDLSTQTSDLTVGRDVTVGRNLNVMSDSSIGGKLSVGGNITFNGTLYANKDACIHNRLYVFDPGYDGSVMIDVSKNGTKISTGTTITKNLTVNGVITAKDVSTHNLVAVSNELNLAGNLSGNSLYFNYRAGSGINQIYMCAGNSTQTSNGNLTKVIAKSLQIGDNNPSYTDSSLLLWTFGQGGSPSIEFRRGTFNDSFTDWRIVLDDNKLKIKYRKESDYRNAVYFDEGKIYLYGTVSGNTNRYISSDASTNVYVSIDNYVPLVVEKNSIRRGASDSYKNTDLGTSLYPWRTGYFDNIYSNNIFSDSIKTQGTTKYMSSIKESGWYKIGETSSSISVPASNTNIFIVNRSYGWGGTEGYIVSFVNDYRYDNGNWSDNSSLVHVQITQISGNYGSEHLITKFATICNKYNTEYYMYYAGSDANNGVFISCIGTASPIAPTKTSKTDADMATGSIFYTDRGAGVRGDFYVNGNYNSTMNGRPYVKISGNTISAYVSNTASTLSTGSSPVSISKKLDVYGGITDYSTLTVTGATNMHNKLTVTNGGIDIQNGNVSVGHHLIFKNTATSGNSVNLITVEEKAHTNRHLDIRTDSLYLSKGEFDQEPTKGAVNLYVDGSITTFNNGRLDVSGSATINSGASISGNTKVDYIMFKKLDSTWPVAPNKNNGHKTIGVNWDYFVGDSVKDIANGVRVQKCRINIKDQTSGSGSLVVNIKNVPLYCMFMIGLHAELQSAGGAYGATYLQINGVNIYHFGYAGNYHKYALVIMYEGSPKIIELN